VGSDLLFAPVLAPNDSTVIVYLPQGRWWNPQTQTLLEGGRTYTLPSPLGKPCLLVRQDAPWRKFLGDVLRDFTSN
jgi:alpha-glucosidase (family GH31 glycosyl hydrolase)